MSLKDIENRIGELGLSLPNAPSPVAKYKPFFQITVNPQSKQKMVFVSGQTSINHSTGELITGKLGEDMTVEDGQFAARMAGLSVLAQLKSAGVLNSGTKLAKLFVMVNATPNFGDHPRVADGCSELMALVLGDNGIATRSALGVASLPHNCAVEVEALAFA